MNDKENLDEVDTQIDEMFKELDIADHADVAEINPPQMNLAIPDEDEDKMQISSEKLENLYDEVLSNSRQDRNQIDGVLDQFLDMVFNSGDPSSATKEAVVNLIKAKSDVNDKMAKVLDLMTRVKLKDNNTFPRFLAAKQENNYNFDNNDTEDLEDLVEMTEIEEVPTE